MHLSSHTMPKSLVHACTKHLVELVANEKVTDVVVAVPPYYSQFEHNAITDAIDISGLRTLATTMTELQWR